MEEQKDMLNMLDLMVQPGFCVNEKKIVKVNQAARSLFLSPGDDVEPLLLTGWEEYAAFSDGCLYLTLSIQGQPCGAAVSRLGNTDVFLLEQSADQEALRSLALAAKELRGPLSRAMMAADALLSASSAGEREPLGQLNQGLYQLLRIVGNMSDAGHYPPSQQTVNVVSALEETFEKARTLLEHTGISLTYQTWQETVFCLLDQDQMERAVYNILSNAAKFMPSGGAIHAGLTRRGRALHLTIQDTGSSIAEDILSSIHRRFLRQPAIEDSRYGIGLGMVLIRSFAASHGGTVLITRNPNGGTRITLTITIRQDEGGLLRSPLLHPDYAGGFDRGLVELSDCLPAKLYDAN